jgi:hypothetical protein
MPTPNPAHDETVDLWDCPCRECTRLEYNAQRTTGMIDGPTETGGLSITAFRCREWPEVYGAAAQEAAATRKALRDLGYQGPFVATDALPEEPPMS